MSFSVLYNINGSGSLPRTQIKIKRMVLQNGTYRNSEIPRNE